MALLQPFSLYCFYFLLLFITTHLLSCLVPFLSRPLSFRLSSSSLFIIIFASPFCRQRLSVYTESSGFDYYSPLHFSTLLLLSFLFLSLNSSPISTILPYQTPSTSQLILPCYQTIYLRFHSPSFLFPFLFHSISHPISFAHFLPSSPFPTPSPTCILPFRHNSADNTKFTLPLTRHDTRHRLPSSPVPVSQIHNLHTCVYHSILISIPKQRLKDPRHPSTAAPKPVTKHILLNLS